MMRLSMDQWQSGRVAEWQSGRVEEWKSGTVPDWLHSVTLSLRSVLVPVFAAAAFAEVVAQELGPQDGASLGGHDLAGEHPGDDLGVLFVAGADPHLADVKNLGRALLQKVLVA